MRRVYEEAIKMKQNRLYLFSDGGRGGGAERRLWTAAETLIKKEGR